MEPYGTSSSADLLVTMHDNLVKYRNVIPGLRSESIGIGYIGKSPVLPCMTIVPESAQIVERYSGFRYVMRHSYECHVFAEGKNEQDSLKKLRSYIDALSDIFRRIDFLQDNNRIVGFGLEIQPAVYAEKSVQLSDSSNVQAYKAREATIVFDLKSKRQRPRQDQKHGTIVKHSDNSGFDAIWYTVFNNRDGRLSHVKEFRKEDTPPRLPGLTIGMKVDRTDREREWSGADSFDHSVQFKCWSKFSSDYRNLLSSVSTADMVWDILDEDETFGGAFWNSELTGIQYGTDGSRNSNQIFYVSQVDLLCRKRRETEIIEYQ